MQLQQSVGDVQSMPCVFDATGPYAVWDTLLGRAGPLVCWCDGFRDNEERDSDVIVHSCATV